MDELSKLKRLPFIDKNGRRVEEKDIDAHTYCPELGKEDGSWSILWYDEDRNEYPTYYRHETLEQTINAAFDGCVENGLIEKPLTVDEMIKSLQELSEQGLGDKEIVGAPYCEYAMGMEFDPIDDAVEMRFE